MVLLTTFCKVFNYKSNCCCINETPATANLPFLPGNLLGMNIEATNCGIIARATAISTPGIPRSDESPYCLTFLFSFRIVFLLFDRLLLLKIDLRLALDLLLEAARLLAAARLS